MIPTFVSCSEKGSITSEILASVMKHLDDHVTIDHSEATPFLLLNGHGSHFGLEFLRYMNDPATKWTVCIGVPYGMNLWQVQSSAQQNGAFKMALKKIKQHIIDKKTKICLPCKIEKHNIVGLVHHAWNDSFQNVESNKTAIQERG